MAQEIHPHITHQKHYLLIILLGLVGPILLTPLRDSGFYFFIPQQLYLGLIVWFIVLKLPTPASKEGGALMLGFIFALVTSIIPLTDIFVVTSFRVFIYQSLLLAPIFMVSVLIMTLPAMKNRAAFFGGLVVALLLNLAFTMLISGGTA